MAVGRYCIIHGIMGMVVDKFGTVKCTECAQDYRTKQLQTLHNKGFRYTQWNELVRCEDSTVEYVEI